LNKLILTETHHIFFLKNLCLCSDFEGGGSSGACTPSGSRQNLGWYFHILLPSVLSFLKIKYHYFRFTFALYPIYLGGKAEYTPATMLAARKFKKYIKKPFSAQNDSGHQEKKVSSII
jgi:hypothetical protein